MPKHTYSTQHNTTQQTQNKESIPSLQNTTQHQRNILKFNAIQQKTRQDKKTQQNTTPYDTVRTLLFKNAFQTFLDIKCLLKISTQFLFPRNKSVSKRNISSS